MVSETGSLASFLKNCRFVNLVSLFFWWNSSILIELGIHTLKMLFQFRLKAQFSVLVQKVTECCNVLSLWRCALCSIGSLCCDCTE